MAKKTEGSTLPAKWDEQLAQFAQHAAEAEKGGGDFFGLKGGILTYEGAPLDGNKMCVVILDSILENVYFSQAYDPDVAAAPTCFAFSREEKLLTPHQVVVDRGLAQHPTCAGCQWNVFGSADVGKGKACRNTRRLALIPAGTIIKDKLTLYTKPEQFSSAIKFMKLPVTSVKDYSAFVKQVAGTLKRPPFAIFTTISVIPDAKSQFKVTFQPTDQVPDALIPTMMQRHEEAKASIDFPYPQMDAEEKPATNGKVDKKAAKKGRKY